MPERDLELKLKLDRSQAKRENAAFVADAKRAEAQLLSDAQAAERAKVELIKQTNREKVAAAVAEMKAVAGLTEKEKERAAAAKRAAGEEAGLHAGTMTALEGASKAVTSFGIQMLGLDSAKAVVGMIVENFDRAKESAYAAVKMVRDYRDALRELAALKGHLGDTTEEVRQQVLFRSTTLQTAADARMFQAMAMGVMESSIDKPGRPARISPDEARKAMEFGGAFQAVEGGAAATHGQLIGVIPQMAGKRVTGEEVGRMERQLFNIFQPGSAEFGPMADMFVKLSPLIKSRSLGMMEAGALLSAFSTSNKEGAGEMVQQFMRATLGGIDKTTKGRVEEGTPQGEYYKSLGVTKELLAKTKPEDLAFVVADKVAADLAAQEAAAAGRGEEFHPLVYLKHKGFMNQEDTRAVIEYANLKRSGQLEAFMALARPEALPTAAEAQAPIARAQERDPAMMARRAALAEEVAGIATGAGKPEYLDTLQRMAFARLKAGDVGRTVPSAGGYESWDALKATSLLSPMGGAARGNVRREALEMLRAEAKRVGITDKEIEAVAPNVPGVRGAFIGPTTDASLYRLGQLVRERGGSALPGFEPVQAAAAGGLGEAARFSGLGEKNQEAVGLLREIRDNTRPQAVEPPKPPPPSIKAPGPPASQDSR